MVEVSEMLGVGWPLRNFPEGPDVSFVEALIPFLVLVALAVIYIVVVSRADRRMRERRIEPEAPEVRKAA